MTGAPREPQPSAEEEVLDVLMRAGFRGAGTAAGSSRADPGGDAGANATATLGRYQLRGEIARGGIGVILRAHDALLGREVALKVLREDLGLDSTRRERFVEEAQIAGQLQHPGIVPVYDFVGGGGRPFIAMKLIAGRSLAELLAEREWLEAERARFLAIFEQVCQTVAYAHARGVVHRDLKPGNVMVGAFGEVMVVDWGLAKVLREEPAAAGPAVAGVVTARSESGEQSVAGTVAGTFAYMPPEQAQGRAAAVDQRADVFALGAILCEVLCGEPPYGVGTTSARERAAAADLGDARSRLAGSGADPELVALASECLATEPAGRPRDAGVVAQRVRQYLDSVERRAREEHVRAEAARRSQRLTLALGGAVLLIVLLVAGGVLFRQHERQERAARLTRGIEQALREAETLRAQAAVEDDDRVYQAALEAGRRAEVAAEDAIVGAETGALVQATLTTLRRQRDEAAEARAAREADARTVARLDELLVPIADFTAGAAAQRALLGQRDRDYAAAFASHGLDGEAGAIEELARRTRASPIRVPLVAGLLDWQRVRRELGNQAGAERLGAVLAAVAPDWLQLEPDDAIARIEAGTLEVGGVVEIAHSLITARRHRDALRVLRVARLRHPGQYHLQFLGGLICTELPPQDYQEAASFLFAAVACRPASRTARRLLVTALVRLERGEEALGVLRRMLDEQPGDAPVLVDLGSILLARKELEAALDAGRRALAAKPELASAHFFTGETLMELGRVEEALPLLRRAVELGETERAPGVLTDALGRLGRHDEALRLARARLEQEPQNALAHEGVGQACLLAGDFEAGTEALREAIRLQPKQWTAHLQLGIALAQHGDTEAGLAALREATRWASHDPAPARALAWWLRAAGRNEAALEVVTRAAATWPGDSLLLVLQNDLRRAPDRHEECLARARAFVARRPHDAQGRYELGYSCWQAGDLDGAIENMREALRLDPRAGRRRATLAQVLAQRGQSTAALEAWTAAFEQLPDDERQVFDAAREIERLRPLAAAETRPRRIVAREVEASDGAELLAAARCAFAYRQGVRAVELYEAAFARAPQAAEEFARMHRFTAARAAALAAGGRAADGAALDAEARAAMRARARAWLDADLAAMQARLAGAAGARSREPIAVRLEAMAADPDLRAVRGRDALAALPEAERGPWQALWQQHAELARRVRE